jgi:hypothetical protein
MNISEHLVGCKYIIKGDIIKYDYFRDGYSTIETS